MTTESTPSIIHSNFFTNKNGNTLMKEFEGILQHNQYIKNLDAVVGFLRASGYFSLRPNKSFLYILSFIDDNFISIVSFIDDKICIFAIVFSISTKKI